MSGNTFFYNPLKIHPLVLIVEADEDTRVMMKYLLQMWRFRTVESDGVEEREVLEAAKTHQPDLILISGRSRQGDHLTTIRQLRERAAFEKTGIIFISAFSEPSVRAAALAAGADSFLIKPIDFGRLEALLKQFARKETVRREIFL